MPAVKAGRPVPGRQHSFKMVGPAAGLLSLELWRDGDRRIPEALASWPNRTGELFIH